MRELSAFASLLGGLPVAVAKGCERLVHPSVSGRGDQLRQGRFVGVMFAGSFFAACTAALLLPASVGPMIAIAAVCMILVIGWLIALLVAATGRDHLAGMLALAVGTVTLAGLVVAAGGAGSAGPPTLLTAAPYTVPMFRRSTTDRRALAARRAASGASA